ncbi:TatD family hydrolase [Flavobacterium psychrotolerans]|uniref:Hydrolase TatD n=1 Tax=Flavobacterium psychrotolerans TaxID=2169410 RepID=A0A2U1JHZ1_9FLAO|nr:TatD family hydrolase [Flavobacterium psychrotolerans]PWA04800.1 hydrolase TatD [Flavobacterium psychrotolerans]
MKFINLHTHNFTNSDSVLELVNQYPNEFDATIPFYSIGIHPWHIAEDRIAEDLMIIESKLKERNCLAIGECGLDKRIEIALELQLQVFEKQLALAEKYKKPVVIHCVAAFQELIEIKNRLEISVPMLIHGFSKNDLLAKQLINNGFYLSFGKYLLRKPELERIFKSIPNNRFFLETDTMEDGIQAVYSLAAKYKNIEIEQLQKQIRSNFEEVFKRDID